MRLIIFAGLPGTGKSSLAEAAAREWHSPVFAKDWLEATLRRSGLGQEPATARLLGYAGYELLTTLAQRQLAQGQSAVLDSVATFERLRQRWRDLAAAYGAAFYAIECTCSDEAIHRARLDGRQRGIPGWYELTWPQVVAVRERYEPWLGERLVVDAVRPLADNLRLVLDYVV